MTEEAPSRRHVTLVGLVTAAGAAATLATAIALVGRFWWMADLATHFRVQYVIVLVLAASGSIVLGAKRRAALFAAVALFNLAMIAPAFLPADRPPEGTPTIRAMLMNVHTANTNHTAVLESIRRHDPDLIVLQEVDDRWMDALRPLGERYPHVTALPRRDNFGIALLARHEPLEAWITDIGPIGLPTIVARFEIDGDRFSVIGTHALPPVSADYAAGRDAHLAALPAMVANEPHPVLLLGDLNVTPWSSHFRRLLRDGGLHNASRSHGVQPTWPTHRRQLLIPIDHALHTPDIRIALTTVGDHVGSDHYPVIVDFAVDAP